MPDAIAYFASRLLLGMALVLCLMPRQHVAAAYFRIMLLVQLGMAVVLGLARPDLGWLAGLVALAAFAGSVFWALERRTAGNAVLVVLLALAVAAAGRMLFEQSIRGSSTWMAAGAALASAGTLGAALSGMLLGHRYLTAPGMPLAPLARVNDLLGLAAACRLVLSALALALIRAEPHDPALITWLSLRWLAGIGGPLAVWFMVRRILIYRNTQSATGLLFVGVILVFIGELSADLAGRMLGIPV